MPILFACESNNQQSIKSKKIEIKPYIVCDSLKNGEVLAVKDLKRISEGEVIESKFAIKNEFQAPLIITQITATCGCVDVEYDSTPIPQGESRVFAIKYDSKFKAGMQFAYVNIKTNQGDFKIRIEVFVKTNNN